MKPLYGLILFFTWLFFKTFYRLKVYGRENFIKGPAIIASNHVSFYDPPAIAAASAEEIHYLARQSLFKIHFLGKLIKKLNAHPLSRSTSDIATFRLIVKLLKEGKKVILFPEGERSYDGKIGEIMPGVSLFVYLSKCTVIPTYIHGAFEIWNRTRKWPKLFGKISVVFGTPIYCTDIEEMDKKEFMRKINHKIEKSLKALQKWSETGFKSSPP